MGRMTPRWCRRATAVGAVAAALMALPWRDRGKVLRDMWRFIVLYKEFKWGRQIFSAAMQRPFIGGYPVRRWL